MALYIGQKRNSDFSSNATEIDIDWSTTIWSRNPFYSNKYFQDAGIVLKGENSFFNIAQVYYVVFRLKKTKKEISFTIRLQHDNDILNTQNPYQIIKNDCILNKKLSEEEEDIQYNYFDLVFTPDRNNTYNRLVLSITREAGDVLYEEFPSPDNIEYPRKFSEVDDNDYKLYSLENLRTDGKYWKKIGVQTRPGSLIVINKQPIRIGRSGIYELNNGTKITSFMTTSGLTLEGQSANMEQADPFLVDYVYTDSQDQENSESSEEQNENGG